ncbi:MAG: nucleotidyltransferase family protein [Thermodesulfovibrionales bacterium]|nr:nucleotidyltransferase family protein [Thermodesulfovibrionales bacterium]
MNKELERIITTLKSLEEQIRKEYKAEIIGIFGSYTRGEQKESSDVDILARFLEGASLLDLVGLANFLEEKLNLKVDIVPADTIREEIRENVLKEAIYL